MRLGRLSPGRHATVAGAVGLTTVLAATGLIGDGNHPERFETWQVVVEPGDGPNELRITETFDQDFGDAKRRGHRRTIPNDFGVPTDVSASSLDASDDLLVTDLGGETEIRIGDPDVTITGQHRYTLTYTLPEAQLDRGLLALDVLGGDEFETLRAEVVVRGFELQDQRCFVGGFGSTERCDLQLDSGVYRAELGRLSPFTGITIDGSIVGRRPLLEVDPLPLPERRRGNRLPIALGVAGLGVAAGATTNRWARRRGRNEVFAGGAADAAYGRLAEPGTAAADQPPAPTTLVPDDELGGLATIEFVPPKGIAPWEAYTLLYERVDDSAVEAWLSGLAGREAVEFAERGANIEIRSGPRRNGLASDDAALLDAILGIGDPFVTGTYDPRFAQAWAAVAAAQRARVQASGWWKRLPPGAGVARQAKTPLVAFAFVAVLVSLGGSAVSAVAGAFSAPVLALALAVGLPAVVALVVYRVLLPARSATGSALALQAESFRRFLHASEARHVEWAWSKGLLREYSGWAVALGEAAAWSRALALANVPAPARVAAGPIIVAGRGSSLDSSHTRPSSSGGSNGGGRGGFSGGSVGGGGGGGSRGSW